MGGVGRRRGVRRFRMKRRPPMIMKIHRSIDTNEATNAMGIETAKTTTLMSGASSVRRIHSPGRVATTHRQFWVEWCQTASSSSPPTACTSPYVATANCVE